MLNKILRKFPIKQWNDRIKFFPNFESQIAEGWFGVRDSLERGVLDRVPDSARYQTANRSTRRTNDRSFKGTRDLVGER